MELYTTNQARANLFKIVDYAAQSHAPAYIVGKQYKTVRISEEDYRSLLETLHITSIPEMTESILTASKEPLENFYE